MSPLARHLSRADVLGTLALLFGVTGCGLLVLSAVRGSPSLADAKSAAEGLFALAGTLLARSGKPATEG